MYPATEGLTQLRLRMLIAQALGELDTAAVRDWIPAAGARVAATCRPCAMRWSCCTGRRDEAQLGELAAATIRHSAGSRSRSCSPTS